VGLAQDGIRIAISKILAIAKQRMPIATLANMLSIKYVADNAQP
jgi:hypothetical protein